jgi:hypothetical protein
MNSPKSPYTSGPRYLAIRLLPSLLFVTLLAGAAWAHVMSLSLAEVAQTADLIFVGTVESTSCRLNNQRTMIFTDVVFGDVRTVHASQNSIQKHAARVTLTHAGGRVGDAAIEVCDTPRFAVGKRYLLFMVDDGSAYASPIVGAAQGQFEVIADVGTNEEYLLTAGGRAVVGADEKGFVAGLEPVARIENGVVVAGRLAASEKRGAVAAPVNAATGEPALPAAIDGPRSKRPTPLRDLLAYLTDVALKTEIPRPRIKRGGTGMFYGSGQQDVEPIQTSAPPRRVIAAEDEDALAEPIPAPDDAEATSDESEKLSGPRSTRGGTLGACGYQTLNIVMQQVPTTWWSWRINEDCMYVWNQTMDVYRKIASDGYWGDNSQNEFAGFPSDADVRSQYGFGWQPGAIAMVIWERGFLQPTCGRITQTDVCWNPGYSWTGDFNVALGNPGVLLLRSVTMHELGHTWGEQMGSFAETYDYDTATVMQPYYSDIVEDGWGIHRSDAYLIRRQYSDQRPILTKRDIGVESYYASNGLKPSQTNLTSYAPGQAIMLNNVLVENMSYTALSNVRLRFYLSTDRTITTSDYQMGADWYWASFPAEYTSLHTYATTVPSNVPAGSYYVGAIVTINGYNSDDLTWNNATFFFRKITVSGAETISNGGFETGTSPWSFGANSTRTTAAPYSGSYAAKLLGYGATRTTSLWQAPAFSGGSAQRTLTFYLKISTAEGTTTARYDSMYVRVASPSGSTLTTLAIFSNANASTYSGYRQVTLTVPAAYCVSGNQVQFFASEDASRQTTFWLDNVSLR